MVNRLNRTHKGKNLNQPQLSSNNFGRRLIQLNSTTTKKEIWAFLMQKFYNLPISRKYLIALVTSELVSVLGIGLGAILIMIISLQNQLREQAKAELTVTDINYDIKINQMGSDFRRQADNAAVIRAATAYNSGQTISTDLKNQVKQLLENEVQAHKIEYATLVGKDLKIIINANTNREGEVFNPNNLVQEVFKNHKQIKASRIVSWSELSKESPHLPKGFRNQDALIRYTVTPVKELATQTVIGALVSGDIVNRKEPIVRETLQATRGGYSAVYLRQLNGSFALATSLLNQGDSENLDKAQYNIELPKQEGISLLKEAAKAQGTAVSRRMVINNHTYTIAAKSLPNTIIQQADEPKIVFDKQPVAILVRGTPETVLNNLLTQSLAEKAFTVLIALIITLFWVVILRNTIIRPIENLQHSAKKFAAGDRSSRTKVFATDEIGQLATSFNTIADDITKQIRSKENQARLALQLNEITAAVRESLDIKTILKAAVSTTREVLQAERVIVYLFNKTYQDEMMTESVTQSCPSALGTNVSDFYSAQEFEIDSVRSVENIYKDSWSQQYLQQLEQLAVKAYLHTPIFLNKKLHGVLVAHQCSDYRQWKDIEIHVFKQVAIQVGYSLEQAELLKHIDEGRQTAETVSITERQQKEILQTQLLELLNDVEEVASGNLTVRTEVTPGEIGTVADFFNSIVESLRDIVTQVKQTANQVNEAIGDNEQAIHQLANEALAQASEINRTLDAVDNMTHSIQAVAASAQQAATVANTAAHTAKK
ncbi:MAG: HAMP domain-containing protein, partial [Scytonema sp. PMC 1069.18]|nr:HAMP domain-containing protein [Scytonema sp. PMC 1069.18]